MDGRVYDISTKTCTVGFQIQGPVSRKSRKLFGSEKLFLKLRRAYSVKLVFSYVVKGIKSKIITKFCASRRLRFEDTKRIMSPEIRPQSSGTFEKRAPGPQILHLVSSNKLTLTAQTKLMFFFY